MDNYTIVSDINKYNLAHTFPLDTTSVNVQVWYES